MASVAPVSSAGWLSVGVLVLELVCVVALVWVHFLPTGQHPVRDAVSNYGAGRYRGWYQTAAGSLGIAGLLLGAAIVLRVRPVPAAVTILLGVFGIARIAISLFPTDLDPAKPTGTGRIHILLAFVAFASLPAAARLFSGAVRGDSAWSATFPLLHLFARGAGIALLVMLVTSAFPTLRRYFGLFERILYVAMIGWIAVAAAAMAVHA